jgi:RPA family protein
MTGENNGEMVRRTREPAKRVFAKELRESSYMFREDNDDKAPKYLLLATGEKANRVLVSGVVTEKEEIGQNEEYWRMRLSDTHTTCLNYISPSYQPEAMNVLSSINPPQNVAVVAKPDTFDVEGDDGETNTITSMKPEVILPVDQSTRDLWMEETVEQTVKRMQKDEDDEYVKMAREHYGDRREEIKNAMEEVLENYDSGV